MSSLPKFSPSLPSQSQDTDDNKDLTVLEANGLSKYEQEKELGIRRENGARNLSKLKPIHYKLIELHISGMSNNEIARRLRKSVPTISIWLNDPLVISELDKYYKAEDARFKALYSKTIDVIEDALNTEKHGINTNMKAARLYLQAHRKFDEDSGPEKETAEDIVQRVMNAIQVNVTVNNGNNGKSGNNSED